MRFMPGTKRTRPRDVGEASARLVAQTEAARRAIHGGDIVIDPFPFKMGRETDHGDNARDANDAELVEVRTNSGLQISRTHLQIEFEHGRYFVRDRHSACGTIVNGQRIGGNHTGGRLEVRDGDVMVLGGTTSPFVFTFVTEPRVSDAILATTGSRAAEPQQPGSPEVVLVVDDDEAVRGLMRRTLEQQGYRVLAARDGTEASSLSRNHTGPLHVLVADIVMPRMSGYVLAERLRSRNVLGCTSCL